MTLEIQVVGFITICTIHAYHHKVVSSNLARGEVYFM